MAKRKSQSDDGPILRADKLVRLIADAEKRIKAKWGTPLDNIMDQGKIEKWKRELSQLGALAK